MKEYYFIFAKTASYMDSILGHDSTTFFPKEFERIRVRVKKDVSLNKVIKEMEKYYSDSDPLYRWICIGAMLLKENCDV